MLKINPDFLNLIKNQSKNDTEENNKIFDTLVSFKTEGDLDKFLEKHNYVDKDNENLQSSFKISNITFEIFYKFTIIPSILIKANYSDLKILEKEELIIQIDGNYRAYLSFSSQKPIKNIHFIKNSLLNPTGKGIRIAIFDSGIDHEHPFLKDRVSSRFNLTNEEKDICGHGTMMAGIICGYSKATSYEFMGIAPKSELIDVKIADRSGNVKILDILIGMESIKDEKVEIILCSAVSLYYNKNYDILSKAFDYFLRKNIIVIAPAGNFGPESGTIGSPGNNENIFCIGTHNDDNEVAFFSSRGEDKLNNKPDLVLHGVNILTTRSTGSILGRHYKDSDFLSDASGTSASAAVFVGLIALLMEVRADLNIKLLKDTIKKSSLDLKASKISQGLGTLDILSLFQNLNVYLTKPIKIKKINRYSLIISITSFLITLLISFIVIYFK